MNNFLYGMWFMWFCLCVYAWEATTLNGYLAFATIALIIPALLVLLARGVCFLVRLVKFKWERRT